jgi:hypothetical protein
MPPELQQRVHEEVQRTKQRSGWPVEKTLTSLGVSRSTYYRWLREEAWAKPASTEAVKPVQPYEALPEEKAAVKAYALAGGNPTEHHRRPLSCDVANGRHLEHCQRRRRRRAHGRSDPRPTEGWGIVFLLQLAVTSKGPRMNELLNLDRVSDIDDGMEPEQLGPIGPTPSDTATVARCLLSSLAIPSMVTAAAFFQEEKHGK